MTKLLTYAICAFTALSVLAAPVDFGDIAADYPLYDSSDPFAIGVSTAAYTSATNANSKIDAHILRTDNPHGVTAAQAGALTAEADTLATVTARGNITSNTVAAFVTDTALSPFPGLYGSSVYGAGVEGHSISSRGVYGGTVGGYGMTAYAGGGGTGILALASSSGVGLFTPHSIISESTITANIFLGDGSALTDMTVSQIAGAYPASNPSNFVTAAQVSAADIRTPLVNVTTGATSTVTVTTAKRVYYVESEAQTTVTNDISALALNCTSNAEWEVWYNATSTNALTPAWDTRMTFLGGNPEMTVTGVYKFALSSLCGTVIQARQTWPETRQWETPPISVGATANTATYGYGLLSNIMGATGTNGYVYVSTPNPSIYWTIKIGVAFSTAAAKAVPCVFSPVITSYGYANEALGYSWTNIEPASAMSGFVSPVFIVPPSATVRAHNGFGWTVTRTTNEGTVYVRNVFMRPSTPQEIQYYNFGGRDFR